MPLPIRQLAKVPTSAQGARAGRMVGSGAVTYRISKGTGYAMVGFAFFLDALPILLAVVMLFATFHGTVPEDNVETAWWNAYAHLKEAAKSFGNMATGAFTAAAGILILAPATYFLASLLVPVFAFLLFLFWFLMKRVNPFSITGALFMMLETLPMVNLLPAITLVVWRRVRASRREDEVRSALTNTSFV